MNTALHTSLLFSQTRNSHLRNIPQFYPSLSPTSHSSNSLHTPPFITLFPSFLSLSSNFYPTSPQNAHNCLSINDTVTHSQQNLGYLPRSSMIFGFDYGYVLNSYYFDSRMNFLVTCELLSLILST